MIFKLAEVGSEPIKFSKSNNELINRLTNRLEQLDLSFKPSSTNTKVVNVITETSNLNIDRLKSIFKDQDPQINRINHQFKQQNKTRNYYPRPTPPDL